MSRPAIPQSRNPASQTVGRLLDWPREAGFETSIKDEISLRVRIKKRKRKAAATGAVAALALLLGALWGVPYIRETSDISTEAASRQAFDFSDGSHAELNARTRIHTDFRYNRRIVRLDSGEAFFTVAKDATHPFLVVTSSGTIRVTGTQFDVRLDDRGAEVTLIEGRVEFSQASKKPVSLAPDEQLSSGDTAPRALSPVALKGALAWRSGLIVLDGMSLGEAMARLSAYHGKPLTVAQEIADLRPGGTFPLDSLPDFFKALQTVLPVRVLPENGGYRLVPK